MRSRSTPKRGHEQARDVEGRFAAMYRAEDESIDLANPMLDDAFDNDADRGALSPPRTESVFGGYALSGQALEREYARAEQHADLDNPLCDARRVDGPWTVDEEDRASDDEKRWGDDAVDGLRLMRRLEWLHAQQSDKTKRMIEADIESNLRTPAKVAARFGLAAAVSLVSPEAGARAARSAGAAATKAAMNRKEWQNPQIARYAALVERLDYAATGRTRTVRVWPTQRRVSLQPKFWQPPRLEPDGCERFAAIAAAVNAVRSAPGGIDYLEEMSGRDGR